MADKTADILEHKVAHIYFCSICDYKTQRKHNYDKHLLTAKHKLLTNVDIKSSNEEINDMNKYQCKCGKNYLQRQSLSRHKKECKFLYSSSENRRNTHSESREVIYDNTTIVNSNIILDIIKENHEFKNLLIDQQKQVMELQKENNIIMNKMVEITHQQLNTPITINNNTNNMNNQFNLSIFLNEKCKDAINFHEFIDSVKITNLDLENTATLGFVDGISKILVNNLKNMSIYERPIHCTDTKRETMYIKDEDEWKKEEDDMKKLKTAFQEITRKNILQIDKWREDNPDYVDLDSEVGMKYIAMMRESMAGNKRDIYHEKIIKNIAKEVALDKIKCEDNNVITS